MKTNTKTIILFIMSLALITIIGISYAYFTATIANNEVKDQVVTTGTLSLRYVDGPEIVMQNIKPGATITKTVYVANTGTLDAVYNLVWQELTNEITNDEMLIEGTCTRLNSTSEEVDGTCNGVDSSVIAETIIKKKITIEPNIIHKYDLKITFKDTNDEQNYNQGKKFSGILGVEEYKPTQFEKDSWETIATNVRNGNISDYNLGDTKELDLGDLGIHNVRIANTTTPDECSTEGFSQTACGFVVEFEDIITTRSMNDASSNTGGWPASTIYTYVNTDIYNVLPTDLKNIIIDTTVVSGHGTGDSTNFTSTDKLYLLTNKEVYGTFPSGTGNDADTAKDSTRQLDYYKKLDVTNKNYEKAIKKYQSVATSWWFRSATYYFEYLFVYDTGMYHGGSWGAGSGYTNNYGVSPAFRIG